MRKIKIENNGLMLWYRNRNNGKVAYAMQYEPSEGLVDENNPTTAPVYIAFDGAEREDLIEVLNEREQLKKKVKALEEKWGTETDRLDYAHQRISKIERLLEEEPTKKWYQFWR